MSHASCYKSRAAHCIGGIFVNHDGEKRVIPDHSLLDAQLLSDSTLLCLIYSNCVIGITGYRLDSIFNDVIGGRLGTVTVAVIADGVEVSETGPFVTGIIHTSKAAPEASELWSVNA